MTPTLDKMKKILIKNIRYDKKSGTIYPCTVVHDRYHGAYSGAEWIAWPLYPTEIPIEADSSDLEASIFWRNNIIPVGKGSTPTKAVEDLKNKVLEFRK